MRALFCFVVLFLMGCDSGTVFTGDGQSGQQAVVQIRWAEVPGNNPFSTDIVSYEVWHNGVHVATVDDNSFDIALAVQPELAEGCIQIKAVTAQESSELSEENCYSFL